jgi:hypothetical protein
VQTASIELTDREATELRQLAELTGADEGDLLKQAALQGLGLMRFEAGLRAMSEGKGSSQAAEIAGLPRAVFLQQAMDRGITMLEGPSTLAAELKNIARERGSERLARAAAQLAESSD